MSVGIIASAAYVNSEMSAEFGLLPPAFLPVGNTRLFKYQVELLRKLVDRVVLSLPESFELSAYDASLLDGLDVRIVRIPDGLRLGESVMLALIQSIEGDEPAVILHGDTLFLGLERCPMEGVSVHRKDHAYPWAVVKQSAPLRLGPSDDGNGAMIVSGLFSFSIGQAFLKCLARANKDFIAALNDYAAGCPSFVAAEYCGEWLDFGHLNTYYDSRRTLTTQRAFNSLSISQGTVTKTSAQRDKMDAEASWYESLPRSLAAFAPAYLGRTQGTSPTGGYSLAYEYLCPLSDLVVFGALPGKVWRQILTTCTEVLAQFRALKPAAVDAAWFDSLYAGKTLARLTAFAREKRISLDEDWLINDRPCPPLYRMVERLSDIIGPAEMQDCGILHGDFCFSNVLYDFRRNSIKLVDPRGYSVPGTPALYGDTRYDIGKLQHSVAGRYDFIMAGYYELVRMGPYALRIDVASPKAHADIERHFADMVCEGDRNRCRVATAISILLFLSMLPLHADDERRQWALLANAGRLYQHYFGGTA